MADSFIISGLLRKHAEILGIIADLKHQLDERRPDLIHIDAVLRLLEPDIELEQIPARHRPPKRSPYFGRGEITRTCLEALRDAEGDGWLSAEEITEAAMIKKGIDPQTDRHLRADFLRRILQTLDSLERRRGTITKSDRGRNGVKWRIAD
jgi:hypothetical protein